MADNRKDIDLSKQNHFTLWQNPENHLYPNFPIKNQQFEQIGKNNGKAGEIKMIGEYVQTGKEFGRGTTAKVYPVKKGEQNFALKKYFTDFQGDFQETDVENCFNREKEFFKENFENPNIVRYFEINESKKFIVMELTSSN